MDNAALNRAIAERVMKFDVAEQFCVADPETGQWEHAFWIEDQSEYTGNPRYQMRLCFYVREVGEWYPVPDYSGNIAAVFIVVEQMQILGYEFSLKTNPDVAAERRYTCLFWPRIGTVGLGYQTTEYPALAICMAAIHTINDSELQSNPKNESGE